MLKTNGTGRVFRLAALVALLAGCARVAVEPKPSASLIAIGTARIDITPDVPIRLTGYSNRVDPSGQIEQRLFAKALAFGDDRARPAVLITVDLIGITRDSTEEIARRLQSAGIERPQLSISATHIHTGPSLAGVLPYIFNTPLSTEQQEIVNSYSAQLVEKLEKVARDALASRRPARVAWTVGHAGFAANRRVLKDGKWIGFGVDLSGAVDRDLPMLTAREPDGSLRAVLVNYACHATTLEAKQNFIHGDWPGAAQELIERRHSDVVAMVAIGTGADANPHPRGGGLPDVERHAREVADEVDRLLTTTSRPITSPPLARFKYIDLSFASLPTRPELAAQATRSGPEGAFARSLIDRLDRGQRIPQTVAYPVQAWAFDDDLAMIFLGGEVVADYGLRLKRELDASRVWVNAYSNDVSFYVASQRLIPQGGYEVDRSMVYYGQPSRLADGTEDRIVAAVRELLPARFVRK